MPPEFITQIRDLTIHIGEPATFDCQVTGYPRPDVAWVKVSIRNVVCIYIGMSICMCLCVCMHLCL